MTIVRIIVNLMRGSTLRSINSARFREELPFPTRHCDTLGKQK
ncbi:hypothetical protein [Burkholderia plantarii]|nr:hypothetical protein [Burkholderia plantarii]